MPHPRHPLPAPGAARVRLTHLVPLAGFVIPSLVIGYGIVLPRAGVGGVNALTVGFATTLIGASVTYVVGIMLALRR